MEVHHHSHTSRKKWSHYFWEFLMLFLAVFCGFLAEYQLEHTIEVQRERKYIKSMLHDLSRDTIAMNNHALFQKRAVTYADSLVQLLNGADPASHSIDIYYYARVLSVFNPFFYSTATINQLKSSGSLRLVSKSSVADSILNYYDIYAQRIQAMEANIEKEIVHFRSAMGGVIDADVIRTMIDTSELAARNRGRFINRPKNNPSLISQDRRDINQLCTHANFLLSLYHFQFTVLRVQKGVAVALMRMLKTEYNLK